MKIKYISLTVFFAIIFVGYFYYQDKTKGKDKYMKYEQQARDDIKNDNKKYYHFGVVPMDEGNKLYYILYKNNVEIVNMNCVAIPGLIYYNDLILKSLN